jgi:hypothetical protein
VWLAVDQRDYSLLCAASSFTYLALDTNYQYMGFKKVFFGGKYVIIIGTIILPL